MSQSSLLCGNYAKKLQDVMIKEAVSDLVKEKQARGRVQRSSYTNVVQSLRVAGMVNVTESAMYQRVKRSLAKIDKQIAQATLPEVVVPQSSSPVSSISSPSDNSSSNDDTSSNAIDKPKAGRPKGSTDEKKRKDGDRYQKCVNAIANDYW